jgi:sortase A
LGLALAAIGAILLAIAAEAVLQDRLSQWSGHRELGMIGLLQPAYAADLRRGSAPSRRPVRGERLAMLNIPRLGVSLVVLEGADDGTLKKGPGHIEETAYPGELGNVAIAGHRDTHFRPLRNIRLNDEITLNTKTSTFRYFIDSIRIIHPTEMEILDPTPGPALTLVTCFPFEFIGNAPMRYIIRATPRPAGGGSGAHASR